MKIKKATQDILPEADAVVILSTEAGDFTDRILHNDEEKQYIRRQKQREQDIILINRLNQQVFVCITDTGKGGFKLKEALRKTGNSVFNETRRFSNSHLAIISDLSASHVLDLLEGFLLSTYKFEKYKSRKSSDGVETISVIQEHVEEKQLSAVYHLAQGVFYARDLINEPLITLNAEALSEGILEMGKEAGFAAQVFDKRHIEALRMGGLLAVNKGSIDPPTFTVMEWKPENHSNKRPYILAGKGVVYDTGGMSLKPTRNSMDYMKVDMAGAATVAGTMYALARNQVSVHVIGLVPATDNRPAGNAYVPGDVIRMHNGKYVEVLNTDAEGRLLLADALSYARRYDPRLVVDIATLTGSAAAAIGSQGSVFMGTADNSSKKRLMDSGNRTYERVVEFPLWEEYDEMLKSDIADLKNVGGRKAAAITAGKFLQHFTDYPWLHIDIAGSAWLDTQNSYRGKGPTGVGIRLLYDFFVNLHH